jgi:hypothetical protein
MFVKNTTPAARQYVKLVETFRDDRGFTCQRVTPPWGNLSESVVEPSVGVAVT